MKSFIVLVFMGVSIFGQLAGAAGAEQYALECERTVKNAREALVTTEELGACADIKSESAANCVFTIWNSRQAFMNVSEIEACSHINTTSAASCVFNSFNGRYAIADVSDVLACVGQ